MALEPSILIRNTAVEIENDARLDALEAADTALDGRLDALEADHSTSYAKLPSAPAGGFIGAFVAGDYRHILFGAGFSISGSGSTFTLKLPQAPGVGLRGAGAAGEYEHVTLGAGLFMTGGAGSRTLNVTASGSATLANGDYGDIVVSSSGAAINIDSSVLTAGGRALIGQSWTSGTEVWALTGASTVTKLKVGASSAADLIDRQTGDARYAAFGSGGGSGTTSDVASRTALAAIASPANNTMRYLAEAGREGWFRFSTANLSASVTNDPGQGIYVPPAAATSGASGAWVRIWSGRISVQWFGALDGTTNTLTACQRAVNLAVTLLAAEVYFPRGVYDFGTGTLSIPAYSSFPLKVLKLTGDGAMQLFGTVGSLSLGTTGTILKSSSTTSTAAVVQVAASSGTFSSYALYVEDMTIRTYDNPQCHGLDAGWAQQLVMRNVQIDTGIYSVIATQPTSTTSCGLITPKNNNAALTECYNVSVSGYYIGVEMNEHAHMIGANVSGCYNALWYQFGNHASYFNGHLQNNIQNFVINGACLFRAEVNIEHAVTGWQETFADIKDVGNLAVRSEIVWSIVKAGIGQSTDFLRNGGVGIVDRRIGESGIGYNNFYSGMTNLSVPNATDTALAFDNTYISDGLVVRSSNHTIIDVTKTGLYTLDASATFVANATGGRMIAIFVNGSTLLARDSCTSPGAADAASVRAEKSAINLTAGDTLTVKVRQTSGGALNMQRDDKLSGVLTAMRLGRTI